MDYTVTTGWLNCAYIATAYWLYSAHTLVMRYLHSYYRMVTQYLHSDYLGTTKWLHTGYSVPTQLLHRDTTHRLSINKHWLHSSYTGWRQRLHTHWLHGTTRMFTRGLCQTVLVPMIKLLLAKKKKPLAKHMPWLKTLPPGKKSMCSNPYPGGTVFPVDLIDLSYGASRLTTCSS